MLPLTKAVQNILEGTINITVFFFPSRVTKYKLCTEYFVNPAGPRVRSSCDARLLDIATATYLSKYFVLGNVGLRHAWQSFFYQHLRRLLFASANPKCLSPKASTGRTICMITSRYCPRTSNTA